MMYHVVLKFVLLCIYLSVYVNGKQTLWTDDDPEYGTTDLDEVHPERHCIDNSACPYHEECKLGKCVCKDGYTKYEDHSSSCKMCPGRNEACEMVDCCFPPEDYICYYGTCQQRGHRYSISLNALMIFQSIFGVAFLFALIALTTQCFRTLWSKRKLAQMRERRDAARIGIERNYTTQYPADPSFAARDLPPQYDSLQNIQMEKPPSYQEAIPVELSNASATWSDSPPAYSDTSQNVQQGRDNPAFRTDSDEQTTATTRVITSEQSAHNTEQVTGASLANEQVDSLISTPVNNQNMRHTTEINSNTN